MPEENRDIILYRGAPLERRLHNEVVQHIKPNSGSVHLGSDLFTSNYGVVGFLLIDYNPEEARDYYPNGDYGWTNSEKEWDDLVKMGGAKKDDLRHKCKFTSIPNTLKLVRYFIMPEAVGDLFRTDKFLGEPMIEKICEEDIVPEDFDERKFPISFDNEKQKEFAAILEQICGENILEKIGLHYLAHKDHRAYQSFHLYMDLMEVRELGQESVVKALARFDQFITRFDTKGKLDEQKKNLAIDEGEQYSTLLLPEDE